VDETVGSTTAQQAGRISSDYKAMEATVISGGVGRAAQMTGGLAGFRTCGFRLGTVWWLSGGRLHGRDLVKP
jgi:hypothetical protein